MLYIFNLYLINCFYYRYLEVGPRDFILMDLVRTKSAPAIGMLRAGVICGYKVVSLFFEISSEFSIFMF